MSDLRTTLLIPNLHCPTCITFVEDYVGSLSPAPSRIDVSILQHHVYLEHDDKFDIAALCEHFALAGYYVVSRYTVGIATGQPISSRQYKDASEVTNNDVPVSMNHEEHENHLHHCASCRNASSEGYRETESDESQAYGRRSGEEKAAIQVKISSNKKPLQTRVAQFVIEGMSCSSCVGKVSKAIEAHSWVVSSSVALLSSSATVSFMGPATRTNDLIKTVGELGYKATLEDVKLVENVDNLEDKTFGKGQSTQETDVWQVKYSIHGLTCSSCVNKVTNAIDSLPFVRSASVNLLLASIEAEIKGEKNIPAITEAVQAAGYTAHLEEVKELDTRQQRFKHTKRTVMIGVAGMTCSQCPLRISTAIQRRFGDAVKLHTLPTWQKAVFNLSYTPHSPDITIRTILDTINAEDNTFSATIIQPPTIEEKAQKMHAKIRRQIFYRAVLSLVIAIPTFVIGIVYMALVPSDESGRMYLMHKVQGVSRAEWALFALSTPVYFFAADLFHRRTAKELYALWRPGSSTSILRRFYRFGSMDMLMSLGTSIAYFASIAELIIAATSLRTHDEATSTGSSYFDSVVFLTMFLLLGRLLEAFTKEKTGEAISKLGKLRPTEASLLIPDTKESETVPISLLETGDHVRVVHGSSPPWDGIVLEGSTTFSEASLTGESRPVKKSIGDVIYSGTINSGEAVIMQITGASGNSMLDQIINAVREGQSRRAPIERVADRLTSHFVPAVTAIAILTWVVWLSLGLSGRLPPDYLDVSVGGWPFWSLQFAIAVFVIACPCGIGLAAPTALFVGGGLAAEHGILAKGGGEAFQEASKIDIVIFDKTGTLTEGDKLAITDQELLAVDQQDGLWNEDLIKQSVWMLEQNSSHPIAKSISKLLQKSGQSSGSLRLSSTQEVAGKGMKGVLTTEGANERSFDMIVGNERLLAEHHVDINKRSSDRIREWQSEAKTVILVAGRAPKQDWILLAMFALSDAVRPDARNVITALRSAGVETWMVSGDNLETAKAISLMVGISSDHVIAGVLPEDKAKKVQELQKKREVLGRTLPSRAIVAMVGDGVNDSPALAVADVGIAIGSGSDVALSAASFVLVKSNLASLLTLITLSRTVFRRVKFNFVWALMYNLIALPVAAGVLYPIKSGGNHVRLDPVWASLAMALSSISVVCSSLLLRTRIPLLGYTSTGQPQF